MLATIFIVCIFLHYGGSQPQELRTRRVAPLNNSSLSSLVGVDQCVTREEVRAELESQLQSQLQSQKQDIIRDVQSRLQSERQSIIRDVRAEIRSLAAEIRQDIQSRVDNCRAATQPTPTTQPTTDSDEVTTQAPTTSTCTCTYTCNGTPGWRRVAYIDMTNTSTTCPQGLRLTSYSKRTCGLSNTAAGCSSTTFSVRGSQYSQVCGRIKGYQVGPTGAFQTKSQGIDSYYVGGVSLTHGAAGSRQHIWTFAAGLSENDDYPQESCPCDAGTVSPHFVGNDYFCESGVNGQWSGAPNAIFPNDPLWDGHNCLSSSTCCHFNNPPWFTKTLPISTTDDIELRLCDNAPRSSDIPLEIIELYVQ